MSGSKKKKQQTSKTRPQPEEAVDGKATGRFSQSSEPLIPQEPMETPSVRSWRNASAWGLAVAVFLVPPLVTLNFPGLAFGSAVMGKEYVLRSTALFWLFFVCGSILSGYSFTLTRRAAPLLALAGLYLAWIPFTQYPHYSVPKITVIVTGAILFFALAALDQKGKDRVARALVAGGSLAIILTLVMSLMPSSILKLSVESRFSQTDTFGNQNFYGIFLLAMIPAAYYVFHSFRDDGRRGWAMACAILLAASAIQFVFTYSRAAYIGAVVAVVVWFMPFSLRKTVKVGGAFLIIAAVIVGSIFALKDKYPYFHRKIVDAPRAMSQRAEIWTIGVSVFAQNPLLGVGPGMLQTRSLGQLSDELLKRTHGGRLVDAHNDTITFALETGIGGALLYLLFIGMVLRDGYRRRDLFGKLAFAGFAGLFVDSLSTAASVQMSTLFFPLMLGAFIAQKDDYLVVRKGGSGGLSSAIGMVGAVFAVTLVWWTYSEFKETVNYTTLEKEAATPNVSVDDVKSKLNAIDDVYPPNPARLKQETWISLKKLELARYLELSTEHYRRDPADLVATFNYGYALLLNGRPAEAEPVLLDCWHRGKAANNLLPALLYVVYHELGNAGQADYFMTVTGKDQDYIKPEPVLARLRKMNIIKR